MKIQEAMSIYDKLKILTDAAKYDVACTSSGTTRHNDGTGIGNCSCYQADCRKGRLSLTKQRYYLRMNVSMIVSIA